MRAYTVLNTSQRGTSAANTFKCGRFKKTRGHSSMRISYAARDKTMGCAVPYRLWAFPVRVTVWPAHAKCALRSPSLSDRGAVRQRHENTTQRATDMLESKSKGLFIRLWKRINAWVEDPPHGTYKSHRGITNLKEVDRPGVQAWVYDCIAGDGFLSSRGTSKSRRLNLESTVSKDQNWDPLK